jgi:hypothetical protein
MISGKYFEKGKIVLVLKSYGGVDVEIHVFLTSALVGGEGSASRPNRVTALERVPCSHRIGGWMGFEVGLDDMEW